MNEDMSKLLDLYDFPELIEEWIQNFQTKKNSKKRKIELYNGNHNNLGRNLIENVKKI
jgi:hypothetical protein